MSESSLVGIGGSAPAEPKLERAIDEQRYLAIDCECGKKCAAYLRHWERVRCFCGRVYWALRPKKDGQMKLFPWPGDYVTQGRPI
jgi:hypothetical protein